MIELLFQHSVCGHKGLWNKLYGGECLKTELVLQYMNLLSMDVFQRVLAKEREKTLMCSSGKRGWGQDTLKGSWQVPNGNLHSCGPDYKGITYVMLRNVSREYFMVRPWCKFQVILCGNERFWWVRSVWEMILFLDDWLFDTVSVQSPRGPSTKDS